MAPATQDRRTLILGIGSLLMGDEGVGVHAVQALAPGAMPPGVTVVDGGTGGFHLLSCFSDYDPIIMIDATMDGRPPGSLALTEPRFATDFPRALTAHDIGLRDLIESAVLVGPLPKIFLITISIAEFRSMETALSGPVEAAIPRVHALIGQILRAATPDLSRR
jgi:hydrogenase maturation protease